MRGRGRFGYAVRMAQFPIWARILAFAIVAVAYVVSVNLFAASLAR
ncbi:hypothetical protein WPS_03530 [Vulcanimicrobium alpinum]|uniref:Uncharacterized protein n=1 Tax=Vulcanimicrobium alpinum TaxID=3016050 RepID=A0AAN1XVI5_UNVUL|nr:hypothetical protein WPS_03530 [Vulcanimicrobium alpinum]